MERKNERDSQGEMACKNKARITKESLDFFGSLPDDVVMVIFGKLCSSASSPPDFFNVLLTCTRLNRLALEPAVLKEAGMKTVAVPAKNWSKDARSFLKKCAQAGSIEATYFAGMIAFYCTEAKKFGKGLLGTAAMKNHAPALYSLAIILFNGSGGSRGSQNLPAACSFCARAANLGHIQSIRELGYCFRDGYGVTKNIQKAHSCLIRATAEEIARDARDARHARDWARHGTSSESLLSIITRVNTIPGFNPGFGHVYSTPFGLEFSPREKHPANLFLLDWFEMRGLKPGMDSGRVGDGLGLCSDAYCGRVETRKNEFRRCPVCRKAKYCSRGCQDHDWKVLHKFECSPMPQLGHDAVDEDL